MFCLHTLYISISIWTQWEPTSGSEFYTIYFKAFYRFQILMTLMHRICIKFYYERCLSYIEISATVAVFIACDATEDDSTINLFFIVLKCLLPSVVHNEIIFIYKQPYYLDSLIYFNY